MLQSGRVVVSPAKQQNGITEFEKLKKENEQLNQEVVKLRLELLKLLKGV